MVQRIYCKCDLCGKVTMLKYQMGHDDFPVIFTCPNCLTELRGQRVNGVESVSSGFVFENATEVTKVDSPDYYLAVSRELLTKNIKCYEQADETALSPFMLLGKTLASLSEKSNWKRAEQFSHLSMKDQTRAFDVVKLWGHGQHEILASVLQKRLPTKLFPLNNRLELSRGMRTWFMLFIAGLLPVNWIEEKQTFELVLQICSKRHQEVETFVQQWEQNGLLGEIEQKLYGVMECFTKLVGGILPAYLVLDSEELSNSMDDYAMSTMSFDALLDFYQKSYEVILYAGILLVALNNIYYRGDYEKLSGDQRKKFSERAMESNRRLMIKECLVDGERFSELILELPHNRVRNSIGHYSTKFDGVTQMIEFIDKHNGVVREERMTLVQFAVLCIENFHTCFYLSEVVYQLRKFFFLIDGDIPFIDYEKIQKELSGSTPKVGRNEPCPCGSGKKYKKCCGR